MKSPGANAARQISGLNINIESDLDMISNSGSRRKQRAKLVASRRPSNASSVTLDRINSPMNDRGSELGSEC
jgi:ParB-like chromosome segregation protein Spo0J